MKTKVHILDNALPIVFNGVTFVSGIYIAHRRVPRRNPISCGAQMKVDNKLSITLGYEFYSREIK